MQVNFFSYLFFCAFHVVYSEELLFLNQRPRPMLYFKRNSENNKVISLTLDGHLCPCRSSTPCCLHLGLELGTLEVLEPRTGWALNRREISSSLGNFLPGLSAPGPPAHSMFDKLYFPLFWLLVGVLSSQAHGLEN